jgi:gas vesicle protein
MDDRTSDCSARTGSRSALAFSFLAGGLAGAALALLFAPHSGKATRQSMGRKLDAAADSARDMKDRAVRRSRELRDEASSRVEGAVAALAGRERGNGDLQDGGSAT